MAGLPQESHGTTGAPHFEHVYGPSSWSGR